MSENARNQDRDDEEDNLPAKGGAAVLPAPNLGGGFFSIYKKGQGYWTRLCTAIAAGGLLLLVGRWLYTEVSVRLATALTTESRNAEVARSLAGKYTLAGVAVAVIIFAVLAWRLMNSPKGAEFLITTDSEMKKVNWASRRELFGSTRVVILFMIFMGVFLFISDIFFGFLFYWIGVLQNKPF